MGWADIEYKRLPDDEIDYPIVCMKHMRHIPCRPCYYDEPDKGGYWDSTDPKDVQAVREYQRSPAEKD